ASYEWLAAITLVFVAFFFLPKFLKCGIYTMPQFLEQRFDTFSRTVMSILMVVVLVAVNITTVIYSGALTASTMFSGHSFLGMPMDVSFFAWAIGIVAAIYVFVGGLKACAWADLIQGAALIAGGAIIAYLAFDAMGAIKIEEIAASPAGADALKNLADSAGGFEKFSAANADKLTMYLPADNSEVPWTALIIGLWIPNFYYWGLNQYIMQRTLGASSLAEGQKGIMFAAFMKILIPFLIVFPGLIAFNLYSGKMADAALNDAKIQTANAEAYSLIFASENLGKFESFGAVDAKTLESAAEKFAAAAKEKGANGVSAENAKELFKNYFKLRAENELQDIRFAYDKAWAEQNPSLVKSVENWNAQMFAKNPNLENPNLKSQLLGKVKTRGLIGYKYDTSFGFLLKELVPANGLTGFIFAALLGAVVSSLASMLNAASTIFTIDIFKRFIKKDASGGAQVLSGRICVALFAVLGCLIAPFLDNPAFGNIFTYIQEFQGFLSPGILAVFLFGLFSKKAPRFAGAVGIAASPVIYGLLKIFLPEVAFLNRMAITFAAILVLMLLMTLIKPLKQEITMPENPNINIEHSKSVYIMGAVVLVITSSLYVYFS
ncbi:MAG: hypothetical protein J6T16_07785, partial [Opitutales bacterium]|nr:hypothetical protein [Opitutales bacterium]